MAVMTYRDALNEALREEMERDPDVFLMDEPTSMLDHSSKLQIRSTILSVVEERTLVVVTHDDFLDGVADRKLNLIAGRFQQ